MLQSNSFDFINVLDRAADASWLRQTTIANNLANVDTPGYKRQDVEFQDILEHELRSTHTSSLQKAVDRVSLDSLEANVYTDYGSYSYRLDRNNVDVDTENVELASEQLRYQTLTSAVTQEFSRFSSVLK